MKIITFNTASELGDAAASHAIQIMQSRPGGLVCTASGDSPRPIYQSLVKQLGKRSPDWRFIGLDEWLDMNGTDAGSCRNFLDRDLFHPLSTPEKDICFFDGKKNVEAECARSDQFIDAHLGIALSILGVGLNGHIGMNEPGTSRRLRSHQAVLDPLTQQTGQKYFTGPTLLRGGITLGLKDILASTAIFLVVTGGHKADILQKIMEAPASEDIPATLLKAHPGCFVYADDAAAARLQFVNHG